ncbi:MAG: inositol monophosphatase family protein [Rickettsiales bacterium]|nr:inositol monophosphatase family protein [Rickettsiales bacterium]
MNYNIYKKFFEVTLKNAGIIALRYFRNQPKSNSKQDGSIVTIADENIEKFITTQIKKNYPTHAIFGEEFSSDAKNLSEEFCFVIDPIDGTSSFASGRPMWGILLGLMHKGKPVLGAIYNPFTEELWLGIKGQKNYKSYYNNKLISSKRSNKNPNQTNIIATTSPDLLDAKGKKLFEEIAKNLNAKKVYGGDCYNYGLLANGYLTATFEQNLKPYDYIPLLPILWGAGIKTLDENGSEIKDFTKEVSIYCRY